MSRPTAVVEETSDRNLPHVHLRAPPLSCGLGGPSPGALSGPHGLWPSHPAWTPEERSFERFWLLRTSSDERSILRDNCTQSNAARKLFPEALSPIASRASPGRGVSLALSSQRSQRQLSANKEEFYQLLREGFRYQKSVLARERVYSLAIAKELEARNDTYLTCSDQLASARCRLQMVESQKSEAIAVAEQLKSELATSQLNARLRAARAYQLEDEAGRLCNMLKSMLACVSLSLQEHATAAALEATALSQELGLAKQALEQARQELEVWKHELERVKLENNALRQMATCAQGEVVLAYKKRAHAEEMGQGCFRKSWWCTVCTQQLADKDVLLEGQRREIRLLEEFVSLLQLEGQEGQAGRAEGHASSHQQRLRRAVVFGGEDGKGNVDDVEAHAHDGGQIVVRTGEHASNNTEGVDMDRVMKEADENSRLRAVLPMERADHVLMGRARRLTWKLQRSECVGALRQWTEWVEEARQQRLLLVSEEEVTDEKVKGARRTREHGQLRARCKPADCAARWQKLRARASCRRLAWLLGLWRSLALCQCRSRNLKLLLAASTRRKHNGIEVAQVLCCFARWAGLSHRSLRPGSSHSGRRVFFRQVSGSPSLRQVSSTARWLQGRSGGGLQEMLIRVQTWRVSEALWGWRCWASDVARSTRMKAWQTRMLSARMLLEHARGQRLAFAWWCHVYKSARRMLQVQALGSGMRSMLCACAYKQWWRLRAALGCWMVMVHCNRAVQAAQNAFLWERNESLKRQLGEMQARLACLLNLEQGRVLVALGERIARTSLRRWSASRDHRCRRRTLATRARIAAERQSRVRCWRAFGGWTGYVEQVRSTQRACSAALARRVRKSQSRLLREWQERLRRRKHFARLRLRVCRGLLACLRCCTWSAWLQQHMVQARRRYLSSRACRRWRRTLLAVGVDRWKSETMRRQRLANVHDKVKYKQRARRLLVSLFRLKEVWYACQMLRKTTNKMTSCVRKYVLRLRWDCWHHRTEQVKHFVRRGWQAAQRLIRLTLSRVLMGWSAFVDCAQQGREHASRCGVLCYETMSARILLRKHAILALSVLAGWRAVNRVRLISRSLRFNTSRKCLYEWMGWVACRHQVYNRWWHVVTRAGVRGVIKRARQVAAACYRAPRLLREEDDIVHAEHMDVIKAASGTMQPASDRTLMLRCLGSPPNMPEYFDRLVRLVYRRLEHGLCRQPLLAWYEFCRECKWSRFLALFTPIMIERRPRPALSTLVRLWRIVTLDNKLCNQDILRLQTATAHACLVRGVLRAWIAVYTTMTLIRMRMARLSAITRASTLWHVFRRWHRCTYASARRARVLASLLWQIFQNKLLRRRRGAAVRKPTRLSRRQRHVLTLQVFRFLSAALAQWTLFLRLQHARRHVCSQLETTRRETELRVSLRAWRQALTKTRVRVRAMSASSHKVRSRIRESMRLWLFLAASRKRWALLALIFQHRHRRRAVRMARMALREWRIAMQSRKIMRSLAWADCRCRWVLRARQALHMWCIHIRLAEGLAHACLCSAYQVVGRALGKWSLEVKKVLVMRAIAAMQTVRWQQRSMMRRLMKTWACRPQDELLKCWRKGPRWRPWGYWKALADVRRLRRVLVALQTRTKSRLDAAMDAMEAMTARKRGAQGGDGVWVRSQAVQSYHASQLATIRERADGTSPANTWSVLQPELVPTLREQQKVDLLVHATNLLILNRALQSYIDLYYEVVGKMGGSHQNTKGRCAALRNRIVWVWTRRRTGTLCHAVMSAWARRLRKDHMHWQRLQCFRFRSMASKLKRGLHMWRNAASLRMRGSAAARAYLRVTARRRVRCLRRCSFEVWARGGQA